MKLYNFLPLTDRLVILARLLFCVHPIMQVLKQYLPESGLTLDLGCGYGVISHLVSKEFPKSSVMGLDMSSRRIEAARQSVRNGNNIEFQIADIRNIEIPSCKAVLIIDILSMIPYWNQKRLLAQCYENLPPGGTVIIKDTCKSPYWKYAYVYVEDKVKTKLGVFGKEVTEHSLHFWDTQEFSGFLSDIGFSVTAIPLKSRLPYPGVFYICQKEQCL